MVAVSWGKSHRKDDSTETAEFKSMCVLQLDKNQDMWNGAEPAARIRLRVRALVSV